MTLSFNFLLQVSSRTSTGTASPITSKESLMGPKIVLSETKSIKTYCGGGECLHVPVSIAVLCESG